MEYESTAANLTTHHWFAILASFVRDLRGREIEVADVVDIENDGVGRISGSKETRINWRQYTNKLADSFS